MPPPLTSTVRDGAGSQKNDDYERQNEEPTDGQHRLEEVYHRRQQDTVAAAGRDNRDAHGKRQDYEEEVAVDDSKPRRAGQCVAPKDGE